MARCVYTCIQASLCVCAAFVEQCAKTNSKNYDDGRMALRGDEVVYDKDISPYGVAHVLDKDDVFVNIKFVDDNYSPGRKLAVGCPVVTTTRPTLHGKVTKIAKKKRKRRQVFVFLLFCWHFVCVPFAGICWHFILCVPFADIDVAVSVGVLLVAVFFLCVPFDAICWHFFFVYPLLAFSVCAICWHLLAFYFVCAIC